MNEAAADKTHHHPEISDKVPFRVSIFGQFRPHQCLKFLPLFGPHLAHFYKNKVRTILEIETLQMCSKLAERKGARAGDHKKSGRPKPRDIVLAYHEIFAGPSPYLYGVSQQTFQDHLKLLRELQATPDAVAKVQITFDDGHISHFQYAAPVLAHFETKAIFFVTAGWTGKQQEYMDWGELKELLAQGHQLQSHGWSHASLVSCSDDQLRRELERSKKLLEDRLSVPVTAISVPHGRWDDRVLAACANAGYTNVYTSDPWGTTQRNRLHLSGRFMMKNTAGEAVLRQLVTRGPGKGHRIKHATKRAIRHAVGDRFYHNMWRTLSADVERTESAACPDPPVTVFHLISSAGFYGAERMVVTLAAALKSTGCHPVIGVFQNSSNPHTEIADRAQEEGLHTEVLPCRGRIDWQAIRQIRGIIRNDRIAVIHSHGFKANFFAVIATLGRRAPLVATCHMHIDQPEPGVLLRLYHLLDRIILRCFRHVIAVSETVERSLIRAGLPRTKVMTISNGIQEFSAESTQSAFAEEIQKCGKTVIGVIARLTPQKGHRYLLSAAPELLKTFPNLLFVFIGNGPDRDELVGMAESLGVAASVRFCGHRTDMPTVYAAIDLFVLPSINEGMPMAILEALMAKRPVVASDVGGVSRLVRNGETGLLVPPGDPEALGSAIAQLLSNPDQGAAMAANGHRWAVENFSARKMAQEYLQVYKASRAEPTRSRIGRLLRIFKSK